MFLSRLTVLLGTALLAHQAYAMDELWSQKNDDGWRSFASIDLWEASDFMPARKIEGDWSGDFSPKEGQNVSLRRYRTELGMGYKEWRLNLEGRQEGMLKASASTLAFVKAYKQSGLPQQAVSYQLGAQMESWSGFGLRAGRWFSLGDEYQPRFFASAVYYMKPQYRSVQATGAASYVDNQHYSFSATELDVNSRYQYLFQQFEPEAKGYSSSLAMDWQINPAWRVQYQLEDVFNRLAWQNLPELQQSLSSAVVQYDSKGYLNYAPLLQGVNRQRTRSVSVPQTHTARVAYQNQQWEFAAQVRHFYGVNLPTLSVANNSVYGRFDASFDTRYKSVGIGWSNRIVGLHLQTDNLNLSHAKVLGVGVQAQYKF
ncbi:hypothetical protein H8L32_08115 [Undibacterium sp. CY18W]|uniref:Uncharacterized protein n=1 Tax=Undibacterium hunanense TaxID=2762292 RepID=A0ABR6ZNI7_9BURK|nr:hypothetical protein [Undibacterium hunanense]MBC3917434.1 hypothetical protein [Undibacterium hunanense]